MYLYGQFKELNSQLNREIAEFERAQAAGAHSLGGGGATFSGSPDAAVEAEAREHVLGGSGSSNMANSPEERRRKVLEATMNRLRKEEAELEDRCGTAGQ